MADIREFPHQRMDKHAQSPRYTFACRDIGYQCDWRTEADSEEKLMEEVEEHGRSAHNFQQLSDQKRFKLRNNIHRAA